MSQQSDPITVKDYLAACWRKMHDESVPDSERDAAARVIAEVVLPSGERPKN